MPPPLKTDIQKLRQLHAKGTLTVQQMGRELGVSGATVSRQLKKLGLAAVRNVVVEQAPKVVAESLNAIEQLQKINQYANELLDLLMRWNRGEPDALQALESRVKRVRVGKSKVLKVKEVKFKDPRDLAVKVMAEIRGQLGLQLEILKTLHDIKVVAEFREALIELLRRTDPKLRDEFLKLLDERQALQRSLRDKPVKPLGDDNDRS